MGNLGKALESQMSQIKIWEVGYLWYAARQGGRGWKRGVEVVKRILYMCIYVYKYIFFILLTGRKFGGAIVLKIHLTVFEVVYYSFVR